MSYNYRSNYRRFEVHSHTDYSNMRLIDCINKPKVLVNKAIELGLSGIAITDHECLSASIELNIYQKEIREKYPNFKIALGNEIYLTDTREMGQAYYHLILIAKDEIGHKQLRKLSSIAWMNSYFDRGMERVPTLKEDLKKIILENPGHLVATSACLGGELSSNILLMEQSRKIEDTKSAEKYYKKAYDFLQYMTSLFGEDFYIECAPAASKDQIMVNKILIQLSKMFYIKLVVGTDAHYLSKKDRYVHKAYLNSKSEEREVDDFYEYAYLQSDEEIIKNLQTSDFSFDDIETIFKNSLDIYDKIEDYDLTHSQVIPKVDVPECHPMQDLKDYPNLSKLEAGDIYERYWLDQCLTKLDEKEKYNDTYLSRLDEEARVKSVIGEKLGTNMFCYPITLQHYIDLFWKCGSTVGAGRGSSCSGLNHYLLGVTQLDPIVWDLPFWRYLNDERVELGDIDLDLCPSKRPLILQKIKEERGQRFNSDIDDLSRENLGCTLVATFKTETTKSTIQTSCRGYRSDEYPMGIDVDIAQYLSSLIPEERGFLWDLNDVINGNEAKDRKPVKTFINEVSQYQGLLEIMLGIEGLISGRSSHASGVIMFDEDPYDFCCFMKTPNGDIITQYDLHMAEAAGNTKYDFLLTDVQDKITQTILSLQEDGQIERNLLLREVYDKYLHPDILPIDNKKTWEAIQNNSVINVFQFDSLVGSQAAKKIKPSNMLELSDANGLMRLMTGEKGEETPMDRYIKYKNNISLWYKEMDNYGLTKEEQKTLEPYFLSSHGVPPSQEQMMKMLMDEKICGFLLKDANAARKIVGKKLMSKVPELHEKVLKSALSKKLGVYVWERGIGPQMGYSFSIIHALAYSFIGFQTAYLATRWHPIYWNTACLIVNSSSLDDSENEYIKDKKKEKNSDYSKIAKALGEIIAQNINVSLIDINKSAFGFKPDVKNNSILYGLKSLSNINKEIVDKIISGRPYHSIKDFMERCPLSKTAMITLIKAGAFDNLDPSVSRKQIMGYYIYQVYGGKTRLTLQNFSGLIQNKLVPEKLSLQVRVYNFTKYLKAYRKIGKYFTFDDISLNFLETYMREIMDNVEVINEVPCMLQSDWDKIYQSYMDAVRDWLKANQEKILSDYNTLLFKQCWDKYAEGNTSHWEMQALCFYHGEHELKNVDKSKYGIVDFSSLSPEPKVDYFIKKKNLNIPIYNLYRIIGTVIAKNDSKSIVTLLTTTGVVNVKFTREYYAMFKKQISEVDSTGKKHVMEKGWFVRGNMLMVTGFRREDTFVAKKYAKTNSHQLYKITKIDEADLTLQHERYTSANAIEEEEE